MRDIAICQAGCYEADYRDVETYVSLFIAHFIKMAAAPHAASAAHDPFAALGNHFFACLRGREAVKEQHDRIVSWKFITDVVATSAVAAPAVPVTPQTKAKPSVLDQMVRILFAALDSVPENGTHPKYGAGRLCM